MLKRLPILCAALLALAACGHGNGGTDAAAPTASASTQAATAGTASTEPTPASTANAPAADASSAPAASTTAPAAAATTASAPAAPAAPFVDNGKWTEGKDYFRIEPAQPKFSETSKIEVLEVFSYGCPACNNFHPVMNELAAKLTPNAQAAYMPASFNPPENWPTLQRAYLTALSLGVAAKANDAMYDAVWKTRALSAMNDSNSGLKPASALPTIDDVARTVYAKVGVDPKEFVAVANSFSINTRMKRADELIKAYGVDGTPTIVVNGTYRFSPTQVGYGQSIDLANFLVSKVAAGK